MDRLLFEGLTLAMRMLLALIQHGHPNLQPQWRRWEREYNEWFERAMEETDGA